jgi:hypothetical protein
MDFLFAPGNSPDENLGRTVLSRRPNTTAITLPAATNHIQGLLAELTKRSKPGGTITLPIGDLVFAAHGLEFGTYFISLSSKLPAPADFELAVQADTSNAIRIDPALVTPAGGAMTTITVRMRACNIGKARPFVEKLQTAMTPTGGSLNMTAPLHFNEFHGIAGGDVEFLAHKFTLKVNTRFAKRDDLLAAFDAGGFTYLDGTAIPTAAWKEWVPTDIHPRSWRQKFNMKVDLDPKVGADATVVLHREYRFETKNYSWTWTAPDPGTDHDRIELLRTTLPQGTLDGKPTGIHAYDPAYEWPIFQRYGFATLDDYVDQLPWTDDFSGGTHHFSARQFEYTVMLPVTDPPTAAVPPAPAPNPVMKFYNFYSRSAGGTVMKLDETNGQLFLIL